MERAEAWRMLAVKCDDYFEELDTSFEFEFCLELELGLVLVLELELGLVLELELGLEQNGHTAWAGAK